MARQDPLYVLCRSEREKRDGTLFSSGRRQGKRAGGLLPLLSGTGATESLGRRAGQPAGHRLPFPLEQRHSRSPLGPARNCARPLRRHPTSVLFSPPRHFVAFVFVFSSTSVTLAPVHAFTATLEAASREHFFVRSCFQVAASPYFHPTPSFPLGLLRHSTHHCPPLHPLSLHPLLSCLTFSPSDAWSFFSTALFLSLLH